MAIIEAQNITKMLNRRTILNEVSFEVEEGDIFGFLGPNGAGKTTTMRILLGLLKPTSGQATVFGKPLGNNNDLRKRVGVLLENDGLYEHLSAYENLKYYAQLYSVSDIEEKIKKLLEFVGLSYRQNDIVGTFSKGMKRRLALARSIIHDPDVLFYDEPSTGLDPEAQKMVRDLILRLSGEKGRTIFLNSNDLDEVQRVCSRVAILQRGEMRAYETVKSLRRKFSKPTVEITLADNREVEKALDLLNSLDFVSQCERDGLRITAIVKGEKTSTILSELMKEDIMVEEVKNVKVYGRHLSEYCKEIGGKNMNSMNMVWLVAQKEIKSVLRNKGLLFTGLFVGVMFGGMNVLFSGSSLAISNALFSVPLLAGMFMGFSLSRFVFLREKQEKIIETLLCTPLSLKSIWLGKALGVTVPAYLFSLLSVSLVMIISSIILQYILLPSAVILIHIVLVVPIFTTAIISLMGFFQFVLGMRENKIIGYLIGLVLVPFMYPSIFGLLLGDVNRIISWFEVGICLIVAVLILVLTTYLSGYLSKEKIVITITSD